MTSFLRVFSGDEGDDGQPSALWPLSRFYADWFVPQHERSEGLKRETHVQYEISIRYWAQLTGDPPLAAIDAACVSRFVDGLRALPARRLRFGESAEGAAKVAPRTVAKHCRHVQLILDRAGPWSPRTREGLGLLERVPTVRRKSRGKLTPKPAYTLDELERLMAAAEKLDVPRLPGLPPALWWWSVLFTGYITAFRISTILALRYEWLVPDGDVTRVYVPQQAVKQDGGMVREVAPDLLAYWERLRPISSGLIHPWPHERGWLQAQRRRLCTAAGVRNLGFHGLRRQHCSGLAKDDPELARLSAGHTSIKTTVGSYIEAEAIAQASRKLKRPRMPSDERQLSLFD